MTFNRLLKMKWKHAMVVFILTFLIVGFLSLMAIKLAQGFWKTPIYRQPLIRYFLFFLVCLGSMILSSIYSINKLGRDFRGEIKPETFRADSIVVVSYVVWVSVWHLIDTSNSNLHYLIMLSGILVLTFVWFVMRLNAKKINELWWKIIE